METGLTPVVISGGMFQRIYPWSFKGHPEQVAGKLTGNRLSDDCETGSVAQALNSGFKFIFKVIR